MKSSGKLQSVLGRDVGEDVFDAKTWLRSAHPNPRFIPLYIRGDHRVYSLWIYQRETNARISSLLKKIHYVASFTIHTIVLYDIDAVAKLTIAYVAHLFLFIMLVRVRAIHVELRKGL
jgi:hypothetical protein